MCCCLLCVVLFFFFFKQKTAYEMRISDWSSDVCSSDLVGFDDLGCLDQALLVGRQLLLPQHFLDLRLDLVKAGEGDRARILDQIGRASCRERVCQYV